MTDDETWVDAEHANTLNAFDTGDTRTTHAIVQNKTAAFKAGQGAEAGSIGYEEEMAPTLTAAPSGSNQVPTIHTTHAIVAHGVSASDDQVAGTLCTNSQGGQRTTDIAGAYVAQTFSVYPEGGNGADIAAAEVDRSPALTQVKSERGIHVAEQMSVRRLTPIECERLMGWPDDWTSPDGIKAPDSKRYAACGDGIVSHVAYWIGCRIQMIEAEDES
jgi:site-specific DNA-cytosine methylase